jgi:hypothetical protein
MVSTHLSLPGNQDFSLFPIPVATVCAQELSAPENTPFWQNYGQNGLNVI